MSTRPLSGVEPAAAIALGGGPPLLSVAEANRLIVRHGLGPDLARAVVLEAVAAAIDLSEAEALPLVASQVQAQGLHSEAELIPWLAAKRWSYDDFRAMATLAERLRRWSRWRFAADVEVNFLDRKGDLDRVVYRQLRVAERDLADELHQRLKARELDFARAVEQFSIGPERHTQGLVGPVPLSATPPQIGARLRAGREGQLWSPVAIGEAWIVLRLERLLPAALDAETREQLLHDLFNRWVDSQVEVLLEGQPLPPVPRPEADAAP